MAELAEGARLLSEYGGYTPSWVRIPFSPPFYRIKVNLSFLGLAFFHAYKIHLALIIIIFPGCY